MHIDVRLLVQGRINVAAQGKCNYLHGVCSFQCPLHRLEGAVSPLSQNRLSGSPSGDLWAATRTRRSHVPPVQPLGAVSTPTVCTTQGPFRSRHLTNRKAKSDGLALSC
ncbi:hypothetical protein HZ326_4476 [Fusarium oxysporum f. sp. albedinis]|nr:hypothetical protein HZ326_4476 [Fusarium oxysporum f. sp. albedinis]